MLDLAFRAPPALAVAENATTPVGLLGAEIWSTTASKKLVWDGSKWAGQAAGGGASVAVADEGTVLTASATSIDFVGDGVTVTNTGGSVTVSVPGGGGGGGGSGTVVAVSSTPPSSPTLNQLWIQI